MGYNSRHPGTTANYRIDRMDRVEVIEDSVLSEEALAKIDGVAAFTEEAFKMFGGERETVVLRFDKQLIGHVFDKFGEDTPMKSVDENTCEATVHVQMAPTFFGWLAQFGDKMQIVEPEGIREMYMLHIAACYGEEE